ncbi:TVP38/TMEM64 family membrane protein [Quillaja saponaria]|uniref:TVP38/TMEM64 family membrane protein n=1 Tax=Quillaja saponaria TaxID=32244 RepID=A0AAD7PER4_QUISA|nr:TVP38/TMEM64 family membrane protein [Quillaja saponaria]KAJ7952423.1 TVP38/TMEM64 family membrane protein [Quillaja saponaria]
MTDYKEDDGEGEVVRELRMRIGSECDDNNGDYVKLRESPEDSEAVTDPPSSGRRGSFWYWVKLVLAFMFLGLLAGVFFKWVGPFFMDKEIIPIIQWETETFSTPVLAVLVFASVALFPTLLLPSTPSMWVAGMTFGYGFGFLLIISAVAVGVSLPYFIGSLFHHKIQGWLEKYPKKASVLRSAGEGNWFHQFRAVTLIRISPFPYIIFNYCAVATNVKYGPYILGSLVGMVPEIFVAFYTGILIWTLEEASNERHTLSALQIIFNVLGFCATVATAIFFTVYAKRQLKELQKEDEALLQ